MLLLAISYKVSVEFVPINDLYSTEVTKKGMVCNVMIDINYNFSSSDKAYSNISRSSVSRKCLQYNYDYAMSFMNNLVTYPHMPR